MAPSPGAPVGGLLFNLGGPDTLDDGRAVFQSRTGPVTWTGPGTEEAVAEPAEGVTDVLVVPVSCVGDHVETLYEVDMLFGDQARAAGIAYHRRTEALNTHPLFIDALAALVTRHLQAHG